MKHSTNDPHGGHGSHGSVPAGSNKRKGSYQNSTSELEVPQLAHNFDHIEEYDSKHEYLSKDELIVKEEIHSHRVSDETDQAQPKEDSNVLEEEETAAKEGIQAASN